MKVTPVRFTDDPAAMRRFLMALGLTTTLESDGGDWVAMEGSGGGVGLHSVASAARPDAAPGLDALSFESEEPLEAVRDRLAAAGFPADIIDESYGRTMLVTDPDGVLLLINETQTDTYGYRRPD